MTAILPRRFVIAAPPRATAWLSEALDRAFGRPAEPSAVLNRLVERLVGPR